MRGAGRGGRIGRGDRDGCRGDIPSIIPIRFGTELPFHGPQEWTWLVATGCQPIASAGTRRQAGSLSLRGSASLSENKSTREAGLPRYKEETTIAG